MTVRKVHADVETAFEVLNSRLPSSLEKVDSSRNKSFIYLSVIEAYLILGKFRDAIKMNEDMKNCKVCSKFYDEGLLTIGRYYEKKGNYDSAVDFYQRAIEASFDTDSDRIREWARSGLDRMITKSLGETELGN
jgi:tetratricopeptide (TPR) repeat protein